MYNRTYGWRNAFATLRRLQMMMSAVRSAAQETAFYSRFLLAVCRGYRLVFVAVAEMVQPKRTTNRHFRPTTPAHRLQMPSFLGIAVHTRTHTHVCPREPNERIEMQTDPDEVNGRRRGSETTCACVGCVCECERNA